MSTADIVNNTASSWWKDRGMRRGMAHIAVCYTAVYSLGYDGSVLSGLQAISTWKRDMGHPEGYTLGLIAAAYYLPKIATAPVAAFINDRFGRRIGMVAGAILMIIGAVVAGLSHNRSMFIGARVILGVGTAVAQITAATLIPELAHPRIRHMCSSFMMIMFNVGSILASWFVFGMVYYPKEGSSWQWKIPALLQGVGPICLLLAIFVPESPRWLLKQGREAEALQILATYHANGAKDDELVIHEVAEIKAGLELEKVVGSTTWSDMIKTPSNRRRVFIAITMASSAQLAGNGVVQYFLVPVLKQVGITKPAETTGINGGLSIWNTICAIVGATLVERVGRRSLILFGFCGMLLSFVIVTGISGAYATHREQSIGLALVPFIFLFSGFYASCLTPVPFLYVTEITPTSLRAKTVSLYLLTTNSWLAFNNFVNPIALKAIAWKYYFVYVAALVYFLGIYWFFMKETKGLTVEEATMLYESEETRQQALETEAAIKARAEITRLEALGATESDKGVVYEDEIKKA